MKIRYCSILFVCVCISVNVFSQTPVFSYGAAWKFLDNGTNQGTAWRAAAFNDAAWVAGNGQLGYGDGDEATVVSYGTNANTKYITTYFRKAITLNPALYSGFTANVKRDDGIIIYVNGTEAYRNNLATGTITYTTLATLAGDDGATAQTFTITPSLFVNGSNTIAVEIHQNAANSSDISFDMELLATPVPVSTSILAYGSNWKFLDNGTNQGTTWKNTTFSDATWASGNAQLGYGDGDEATVVSYGTNASKKYITTYFRKSITVDTSLYTAYTLNIKRDDGAVVYINGTEVFRSNMPTGTIIYTTKASTAASDDGAAVQTKALTLAQLKQGVNVLAVEMHQNDITSSDLSFDLELKGTAKSGASSPPVVLANLTRGPYMNLATQNSIIIRWRSSVATNSKVSFGPTPASTEQTVIDNTLTTEHIVTLTGLQQHTQYYYSIGSTTQTLQGDVSNYFKTMPAVGSTEKIRVLAMGDMGNNSTNEVNVRNAYTNFNTGKYTDVWMLMGDNAYNSGLDSEYQSNLFNIYQGSIMKNHVMWPSPGNHDYANVSTRQADHAIPYYDIFSLPKSGEAGGVPSNTEAFYSYNYGNIHFVSLDSYGWETGNTRLYDTLGPQAVWLKQDLAANTQKWTVVYFHHPPYTKGSHDSDTDTELTGIRTKIVPILERYKVDLVLNGHSHSYERSYLLNGLYGTESTFSLAANALSNSSAFYNGTTNSCTYIKNASDKKNGIVYAVVGSAGQVGGSSSGYPHNAMFYSNVTNGGALFFEVENNRLDAKWIGSDAVIRDNFTIMKDVNKTTNITITSGSSATLTTSWIGAYSWNTGATVRSISVSPIANTSYIVTDGNGCLADNFIVTVVPAFTGNQTLSTERIIPPATMLEIYPAVTTAGTFIKISTKNPLNKVHAAVFDMQGQLINSFDIAGSKNYDTRGLRPAVYKIRFVDENTVYTKSFIITE